MSEQDTHAQAFIAYRGADPSVCGFPLFYAGWQARASLPSNPEHDTYGAPPVGALTSAAEQFVAWHKDGHDALTSGMLDYFAEIFGEALAAAPAPAGFVQAEPVWCDACSQMVSTQCPSGMCEMKKGVAPERQDPLSRTRDEHSPGLAASIVRWKNLDAAMGDPLFQALRGIMGTANHGQDEALFRVLSHFEAAHPKPAAQSEGERPCALCGSKARIPPTCDACHDSMGTKPKPAAPAEHIASPDCWCEPEVDYVDPDTGATVYVHKGKQ